MTTVVYQGLQSCHESPLAESRTLRLRFSPKRSFSQSFELALKPGFLDSNIKELSEKNQQPREEISTTQKPNVHVEKHTISNSDSTGLTFLQIMSNHSQPPKETTPQESNNVYVHPSAKRHSTLSDKSLQLCTENLGSETGTEITDTSILSLSFKAGDYVSPTMEKHSSRQLLVSKKKTKSSPPSSFPPPLTTMARGSEIQVRTHREDGRLIIEAVKGPSSHTYLHAERSNGRLLITIVKDSCDDLDVPSFSAPAKENEDLIENDVSSDKAQKEAEEEGENSSPSPPISSQSPPQEEEQNLKEVKMDEGCGEDEEGMNGNEVGFGPEKGLEDFQRPNCRCNGEVKNKGLINWERLWVASS